MAFNQMFSPIWQLFNNNGTPLTGGSIWFFDNTNITKKKSVYQDNAGAMPWPNPIILNAGGFQALNYGLFGSGAYYIEVHETADQLSQLIFSQGNYIPPQAGGGGPVIPTTDIQNFIENGQFSITGQPYNTQDVSVPDSILNLAPDAWVFIKNDTSAEDTITFPQFIFGQTDVPANPTNYFYYNCSTVSSTENLKYLGYRFNNYKNNGLTAGSGVNTLSGQTVTFQFEGKSAFNSIVTISVYQYFGPNGSTPVLTPVSGATFNLTTNWSTASQGSPFNITFTIPSISGQTIDSNGGDYLEIRMNFPLNAVSQVNLTNIALQNVSSLIAFQPIPINQLQSAVLNTEFPVISTQNQQYLDGNYDTVLLKGNTSFSLVPRAGQIIYWPTNVSPSYGLSCNGFSIYSYQYYNLAQALWDTNQTKLPWGTAPSGFTTSLSTATITATCVSNGTITAGSAGTTGFTYTQVSVGGSGSQGQATILCVAAAPSMAGQYFLMNSPIDSYYFWLSLNNFTPDPGNYVPALSGKKGVKTIFTGTETDAQLAAKIQIQINLAQIQLPDFRGLFIRMWAQGVASVLHSYTNILIASAGNDSGITFALSGFDNLGNAVSENLTGSNGGTATSANKYFGVVSITPSGNTASTVTAGDVSSATGLCLSQNGTAATALLLNGPYMRDPDYLSRGLLFVGGGTGNNVGSDQATKNLAHTHTFPQLISNQGTGGSSITYFQGGSGNATSSTSGGNQSNPNNVYANAIILF